MIKKIHIVDYGVGNLLSVQRGVQKCEGNPILSSDPEEILNADKIILPGVGAFKNAMSSLKELSLDKAIQEFASKGKPILGICLGMQMFLDESEEFEITDGLGLIPGRVIPVPSADINNNPIKVPHIGWNSLKQNESGMSWSKSILSNTKIGDYCYFVHSFMSSPEDIKHRLSDCIYGGHKVSAVIKKDNVTGCQFHPEKSGKVGLDILKNFVQEKNDKCD